MKIDGRCHCGFITFEAEIEPEKVWLCRLESIVALVQRPSGESTCRCHHAAFMTNLAGRSSRTTRLRPAPFAL